MADKNKKFVSPVGAKNVAAAKAAWSGGAPATNNASSAPATAAAKKPEEPKPAAAEPAKTAAASSAAKPAAAGAAAGKAAAAPIKESVKEEPPAPVPAAAPAKPQHTTRARKRQDSESSSEVSSEEDDSDLYSDEEEEEKPKKIDIGVSLSAIKAAFQQDNEARKQIKKGYDADEFKREVKMATGGTQEAAAENEPESTPSDVVRSAVLNDLGLDVVRKANIRDTKSRFEQGMGDENGRHAENDELKELKNRSVVSGDKSKWENPEEMKGERGEKQLDQDIEVAACKARKMKEKFERKMRKEEKKSKTPKPKSRSSMQADHHE